MALFFPVPRVVLIRLLLAHAEVAQVRAAVLVAPGDVDVVLRAIERCEPSRCGCR